MLACTNRCPSISRVREVTVSTGRALFGAHQSQIRSLVSRKNPLFLSHIADLAAEPEVRQLLIGLLRAATPTFASPLYIGVATNLRTRLSEHRTAYETARANLRLKPSAASHMQFEGESFGERLAGAGMQLEHLQCWMLQVDFVATFFQSSRETMTARQIAESAEWVLQRIFFQPVLGRK